MGLQSPKPATAEQGLHARRAKRPRGKSSRRSAEEPTPQEVPQAGADEEPVIAEEAEQPEKRLRFVDVLTECPNGDAASATELIVNDRGYSEVESLESCRELRKLELRGSRLDELGFLEMNHNLCWLGLSRNRLSRINNLQNLASLAVLDLSDNQLTRLDGFAGLIALKALIAARNKISSLEGLSPKRNPSLETVVLSHNRISECKLAGFQSLRKLSLAHNQLHAFPSLTKLPELSELRLNGNRICAITNDVVMLPKLAILDIGNNLVSSATAIETLRGLRWMKSLNLFGNPVAGDMEGTPLKGLLDSLHKLEIVNNRRLRSAPHKQKRRACHAEKIEASSTAVSDHGRDAGGKRRHLKENSEPGASSQLCEDAAIRTSAKRRPGKKRKTPPEDRAVAPGIDQPKKNKKKRKKLRSKTGVSEGVGS